MFPEVDQVHIRKARDDLYLFGDTSAMVKLFMNVIPNVSERELEKEEEYEGELEHVYDEIG